MQQNNSILFVDMDNTLLATDVLWESIFLLCRHKPLLVLMLPLWALKGKVYFKQQVHNHVAPNPSALPVHTSVLEYLHKEKENGRTIVLATATLRKVAQPIANHFGIFDDVIATTDGANLGGAAKLEVMRTMAGNRPFAYIGDRSVDIPIWQGSNGALVVNPTTTLRKKANVEFTHVFTEPKATLTTYLKAIRVHQWVKNLLLFVPLFMAHKAGNVQLLMQCFLGFVTFSLCASAVYVLNDLLDLEADREHPRKRKRPFASGMIPVQYGVVLVPLLLTLAFGISLWVLPLQFTAALLLYMIFTSAYSFYLKSKLIIDVLMLAGLYAFRLLAGGVVVDVFVSRWMLAFSMFMFLSLAFIKRYTELQAVSEQNKETAKGRGYTVSDNEMIRSIGPASGYMAVLVLALYINSTDVVQLYKSPSRLWLIEPMLLYWITRVWFLAHRGDVHDDPIIFALKDKRSYIVFAICAVVVVLATM